jgi:hypothetical protein
MHQRVFDFLNDVNDGAYDNVTAHRIHLDDYVLALRCGIALVCRRESSFHSPNNYWLR